VFDVIGSLNQQAQQFYQPDTDKNSAQLFVLSKNDFSTCVKALGELPYNRVCSLIQNLHQQLTTQLHTMPDNQSNDSENAGNLTMNSNISGMKTTP
jgi:hypothetical protein